MNYLNAYNSLSERIRQKASSPEKRGLASRDTTPLDIPERDVQKDYMEMINSLFPQKQAEEEIKTYVENVENTDAPASSSKPRGRGQVDQGDVQEYIFNGLVSRGIPEHLAEAMIMNIADESGFKASIEEYEPNVHGTRGKGLYQKTGSRREAFESKYGDDWSIDNQLDHFIYEITGPEKRAWEKVSSTDNAQDAAVAIVTHFLRPAKKHRDSRAKKYKNSVGYKRRNS